MAGIDDVAERAGVSTATVSRALSGRGPVAEATRARVEEAARSLGYVVSSTASGLASGRTRNIGVLLPYLDRWFFSTVLGGIADTLLDDGYDIALYNLTDDRRHRAEIFETSLRRGRVDGVIAISIELDADERRRLSELNRPVVAIGGPTPGVATLSVDDVAVGRLATEHLLALGHTRIAHLGADTRFDSDFHVPAQRRAGFDAALEAAGIPAAAAPFDGADFTVRGGHDAATRLLDVDDAPTAIFAVSDEMAIGAMLAARELGLRVPEDVSVVGVDGHELGEFFQLTTVAQFPREQGARAAAAILAAIEGEPPHAEPLEHRLVDRGSTAPPPR